LLAAAFLVGGIDRVSLYPMSLPGRFFGLLTFFLLTGGLIFVPWTWIKKTTAIKTRDLFHSHLLLLKENGNKIE
jgi:hypothetical protein